MKTKIKKILTREFRISFLEKINNSLKKLRLTEKTFFWFFTGILFFSTLTMLYKINDSFLVEVPTKGGSLTEGIIGTPRFINPLLAVSNADRDLTILLYSGLLKATPEGKLIPDLAKEYNISKDGLIYTFKLKDNLYFHDKKPLTTDDIEFTIKLSQNNIIKSNKKANWDGVTIKKISGKEIQFILKNPYSPFLENMTLGILPKHLWNKIEPEQFAFSKFNIEPIGSGPYKIKKVEKDSSGILKKYVLESFKNYSLGEPYITKLQIKFYPNEEKLISNFKKNNIESISAISSIETKKLSEEEKIRIERSPLPRIFAVFFNQNQNEIFSHAEIRKALNKAIDREKIVNEILNGYGIAINGPIPPSSKYFNQSIPTQKIDVESAIKILEKNHWKLNEETGIREKKFKKVTIPLKFSISTSNAPELKEAIQIIKESWEKIGAEVTIKIFEIGDLNQNVIRPRNYEALLFGEIIGRDMDLFAFWHSSQRNDPGLNIALYTNITVDKLLEDARSIHNKETRVEKYKKFQEEILNDIPVVFVYSPDFIYIIPEKIKHFSLGQITTSSERFLDIQNWNIKTDKVWKIFIKNKN